MSQHIMKMVVETFLIVSNTLFGKLYTPLELLMMKDLQLLQYHFSFFIFVYLVANYTILR